MVSIGPGTRLAPVWPAGIPEALPGPDGVVLCVPVHPAIKIKNKKIVQISEIKT
jgi:hypothetical protein